MKILILEDDTRRIDVFVAKLGITHELTYVDTAAEAIRLLDETRTKGGPRSYDVIFLDHDLGGETYVDPNNTNTGSEVVRWLIEGYYRTPTIIIHSMNLPAAKAMENSLEVNGFRFLHRINFGFLATNYLDDPSFLSND